MSIGNRKSLALAISVFFCGVASAADTDYTRLTPQQTADAVAQGAVVVHDYGSFAWVRGSGKGASAEKTFGLDLGGQVFDPLVDNAANERAYAEGKALRIIQFDGPTQEDWLRTLAADGVTVLQYVHPFSYVVWADEQTLARSKTRSAVRWGGDFLPRYKTAGFIDGLARNETEWRAMLYRGAHVDDAVLRSSGADVGRRAVIDRQFEIVELQANADSLQRLAQMPAVYALSPVPRDGGLRAELANQITANNLNVSNLPVPGYLAWLTGAGVNGTGVVIANVDGGIFDTHPDLIGRMLPCVGDTCGNAATNAHGTHTAAIMAADGSSGVNDANGFRRGLGMAPGAKLVEQVYNPTFTQAGGMLKLMRQSNDNGADLSGNSWGPAGTPTGYDADTRQVDVGTRDTKPDIAGDQPLTYVLSFMNGNGGTSSQGSPDEAKNIITVGSTKAQTGTGAVIPAFDDVSDNSAHGPALDGRRIPHLVAPGCSVDSAASATGYQLMCGTSMASPQVSGAVALFIQKYRAAHTVSPSAALTKAALIASSKDLFGHLDADGGTLAHRPDSKQGWGRLRADWLINPAAPVLYFDQGTQVFDNTGEAWTRTLAPANPSLPMQLVLVYTDAPGHGLGGSTPAWNNDLDLEVTAGSTLYRGNVFGASGFSASGGIADTRNNIESVVLDAATVSAAGSLSVRVVASNLSSDALPNSGDTTDQDFALVCVNCVSQPDYTVSAANANQSVCTTSTSSVTYPISIGSNLGYTDPVSLSLTGIPAGASGTVLPSPVVPPGSSTATLSSLNAVAAGTYTIQLQASSTSGIKNRDLTLVAATAIPAAVTPGAPANNALNVAVRPTLSWPTSSQAAQYLVEVATDAAFTNIVFSTTTATTSAQPATDLATSTVYFWRVRPANSCGNGTAPTVFQFTTVAAPGDCGPGTSTHVLLSDDVENGINGWTASAGSGTTTWAISTARPYGGGAGHAWLAQDIVTASDQRLASVDIALPSGENPLSLQFQSDQTMETSTGGCWDGGFMEISTNAGSSYAALPAAAMLTDPYNGALGSGNPAAPAQAWCGDPQAYLKSVVDLSAYAGQTVRLRFRMTTDGSQGRMPHGWYVDNIRVQGCALPLPDGIFSDGFQ